MWILGGEFFFWSKAVDPRRKPRVYCLAPEKNPPLISTTLDPFRTKTKKPLKDEEQMMMLEASAALLISCLSQVKRVK